MTSTLGRASEPQTATEPAGPTGDGPIRVEGRLKVTGAAKYAADHTPSGTVYAVLVGASIARGAVTAIDANRALAVPGVLRVLTRADMPTFGEVGFPAAVMSLPMQTDEVRYEGEPVAVVLAETLEAADTGRSLVVVTYEARLPVLPGEGEREPAPEGAPVAGAFEKGNVDAALEAADHTVVATYLQPSRHHNTMETSGTLALWEDGALTVWDSVQASSNLTPVLTAALGIEPSALRIHAPHTGGGFGSKAFVWPHQVLAPACARIIDRPVKLHLRRADQYVGTGYQPDVTQDIMLGSDAEGHLTAMRHRVRNTTALADTYVEPASETKAVYACPNISTAQEIERVSLGLPTPMRAPMEGVGLWAVEGAMNELAAATGLDPLELRLRNHADTDPVSGRPWSSKKLREAYSTGAKTFGWAQRHDGPRRDGAWQIGTGMATCSMGTFRFFGNASVVLSADGNAVVRIDVQDIGTGIQTVLCQIAADELSLPLARVSVDWGDSKLPLTGPLYGSAGTMASGSAVALACRELKSKLSELSDLSDPTAALRQAGLDELGADGSFMPPGGVPFDADGGEGPHAIRTFGAVFVEVGVDPELGLVRLRRAVGSYSVGRVMNSRTARSQMIGGIIWGWGKATMERSVADRQSARWLSKNLSAVHLPVNADIPADVDVQFVPEFDTHASLLGAKGIGELGATGVDAAVADAVHDAVGVRLRELPITPARLLEALAQQ